MKEILNNCHEHHGSKKRIKSKALELFRSLVERKIIEFVRSEPEGQHALRLNLDLQKDFSLNQSLSLFLIDTISLIDPYAEDYAIKLLTFAESICENPDAILRKQLDKVKSELVQRLKEEGVEYERRMELLEEATYPKPMSDFIYQTFNQFAKNHPWVEHENIRPKSIAREMYEQCLSFNDYIKEYKLERSEGILLRYLTEVFKILTQTIPQKMRSEQLEEIIYLIKSNITDIDSSLIDEWEKIKNPISFQNQKISEKLEEEKKKQELGILYDKEEFQSRIRKEIHRFIRFLALDKYENALNIIDNPSEWSISKIEEVINEFYRQYDNIVLDNEFRNKKHTRFIENELFWNIEQTIIDNEHNNNWNIYFKIDILRCKKENKIFLTLLNISSL